MGAVWHGCLCVARVLYADCSEWMDDTDVGHNSTFYPLPTVYFSQNSKKKFKLSASLS